MRHAGWRVFVCLGCGREWDQACRSKTSPSGEDCANCGSWVFPSDYYDDGVPQADEFLNLIENYPDRVHKQGDPQCTAS